MNSTKSVGQWMAERNLDMEKMLAVSRLERKVLEAIIQGRYTPSPQQRQRVADALGVDAADIQWGHVNEVAHVYGHGPQFGHLVIRQRAVDRREFVALAYARFQPATGIVRLANAGMPDPYLISNSVTAISVGGARLPLGVRHNVPYESVELHLDRGDRLLLLSDGIPEASKPNGDQLGYEAFRDLLIDVRSSDGWIDDVLARVRTQVQSIDDDWTVVVLERR